MRSNGALKPHQGAPIYGRSTGAKKFRGKSQRRSCKKFNNNNNKNGNSSYKRQRLYDQKVKAWLLQNINNKNNSNNNNKKETLINNSQSSSAQEREKQHNSSKQQLKQRKQELTTVKISNDNNNNNCTKIHVKFCTRNNNNIIQATSQRQQQVNVKFHYENYHTARISAAAAVAGGDNNFNGSTAIIKGMLLNDVAVGSSADSNNKLHQRFKLSTQFLLLPLMLLLSRILRLLLVERLSATAVKMVVRVQQSLVRLTKVGRAGAVGNGALTTTGGVGGGGGDGGRGLALGVLCLFSALALLPRPIACDDGDNFFAVNSFSMGPETTTPEFDYASRGQKKFGDKCDNTLECGFPGSICDPKKKSCQCTEDLPVTNHIDKCGKEAAVNESCFFNEQCEVKYFQTECRDGRCVCRFEMTPIWGKDGTVECKGRQEKRGPETYIDPAMIGVLVGMALMFIIICVVLRLFSQARWRENRTIFNTPNPRLMNVSLLRDSKLLHGQERRGSRMSVRAPSRQPSMASLRPHSPNPSLGKTGSQNNSQCSNASATSLRSTRSNSVAPGNIMNSHHERKGSSHHQHHHSQHHPQQPQPLPQPQQQQQQEPLITNITTNPAAESVTVEIIGPEK